MKQWILKDIELQRIIVEGMKKENVSWLKTFEKDDLEMWYLKILLQFSEYSRHLLNARLSESIKNRFLPISTFILYPSIVLQKIILIQWNTPLPLPFQSNVNQEKRSKPNKPFWHKYSEQKHV